MNTLAMARCASTAMQRARGEGRIAVRAHDRRTRLGQLYQDGCAKIRLPRDPDALGVEAVLINTAGGITGGDRLSWNAVADTGAHLTLTTQACERIYRSTGGAAEVAVRLEARRQGTLHWLPQETILFDGGEVSRTFEVELAADAELIAVEAVVLGRTAMGEQVRAGSLRDRWRVRRDGRLVFADHVRISGKVADTASALPTLAGACAYASLLLVAQDAEAKLADVRAALGAGGGASAFDGKLFARIVAQDGRTLRRALIPALEVMRGAVLPRIWRS